MDSVVHFEITYEDEKRAQSFYEDIFGWNISTMPEMDYTFANSAEVNEEGRITQPGAINGGMFKRQDPFKGPVIVMGVDSIDDTADKIEQQGGEIVLPKQPVGNMGFTCYFRDTEGNLLGLWEAASKD